MTDPRTDLLAELSDRQKDVLRLALTMTSDEIAATLSRQNGTPITAKAVNNRIDAAREKLGGIPRRQAAELLAAAEGRLVEPRGRRGDKIPDAKIPMAIPRPAIAPDAIGAAATNDPRPFEQGRRRNELDAWQRIGMILLMMSGFAATAGLYILSLHLL